MTVLIITVLGIYYLPGTTNSTNNKVTIGFFIKRKVVRLIKEDSFAAHRQFVTVNPYFIGL